MTGNYNQYNSKDYTYFLIQDKNHLKIQEKNINIKKRPFNEEKTRRVVCLQSEVLGLAKDFSLYVTDYYLLSPNFSAYSAACSEAARSAVSISRAHDKAITWQLSA